MSRWSAYIPSIGPSSQYLTCCLEIYFIPLSATVKRHLEGGHSCYAPLHNNERRSVEQGKMLGYDSTNAVQQGT